MFGMKYIIDESEDDFDDFGDFKTTCSGSDEEIEEEKESLL